MAIDIDTLDSFTRGYIGAALWLLTDDDALDLDSEYSEEDLADETLAKIVADCKKFQEQAGDLITRENLERMPDDDYRSTFGHDFWLTRNGHGAGFWDGDYAEPAGTELDKLSKSFGEIDLYVGDDGKLYL
jgi:hypothetical protein